MPLAAAIYVRFLFEVHVRLRTFLAGILAPRDRLPPTNPFLVDPVPVWEQGEGSAVLTERCETQLAGP